MHFMGQTVPLSYTYLKKIYIHITFYSFVIFIWCSALDEYPSCDIFLKSFQIITSVNQILFRTIENKMHLNVLYFLQ